MSKIPKPPALHSSWLPPGSIKKKDEASTKDESKESSQVDVQSVESLPKRRALEAKTIDDANRPVQSMRDIKISQESKLAKKQRRKVRTPLVPEAPSKLALVTMRWKERL